MCEESSAHLARVSAPTLYLQGTRDELADLELMRGICDKLPSAHARRTRFLKSWSGNPCASATISWELSLQARVRYSSSLSNDPVQPPVIPALPLMKVSSSSQDVSP
jgi:hypothetical protein